MSEIIIGLETVKALVEKSENDAVLDGCGTMRPDIVSLKVAGLVFFEALSSFYGNCSSNWCKRDDYLAYRKAFQSSIRPI